MQFRSVRRRFKGRYRRSVGPIEVVALLNIILLMGMFVFTGSSFVLQPGIRVQLPSAPFLDGEAYGLRVLTLTQEGLVFFNDELLDMKRLEEALSRPVAESALLIEADEGTPYGVLVQVYSMAVRAGIREVVLATRPLAVVP